MFDRTTRSLFSVFLLQLDEYYTDSLSCEGVVESYAVDVDAYGFCRDAELAKVITLALGCAVHCETRDRFVAALMKLPIDAQKEIARTLEPLVRRLSRQPATPLCEDSALSTSSAGLSDAEDDEEDDGFEKRADLHAKAATLQTKVDALQVDKATLETAMELLQTEKRHLSEDLESSVREKIQLVGALKDQQHGDESDGERSATCESEVAHRRVEELEAEMRRMRVEIGRLRKAEAESSALSDELDEMRSRSIALDRTEHSLMHHKRRLEELPQLHEQLRCG